MDGNGGFLKTVSFGGFDKKSVLDYIDDLNSKIYSLQAELDEKKALLSSQKDGSGDSEKYEKLLAADKQKISELQTANDSIKLQMKTIQDESAEKDKEIDSLKKKVTSLESELEEAKNKAAASGDHSAMDLSNVFIEAQKSANSIVNQAKENARKMDEDAKKLANQVVDDANSKASTIVKNADEKANKILTDAEGKSATIIADAEDKSAEMKAAAAHMKQLVLDEVAVIDTKITQIKETIEAFSEESIAKIKQTKESVAEAEKAFKDGKIPPAYASNVPAAAAPKPSPALPPKPAAAPQPAVKPLPLPKAPAPNAVAAAAAANSASAPASPAAAPKPAAPAAPGTPVAPAASAAAPMPATPTPRPPIPKAAQRPTPATPKPTPKITFDLSEIENMAKQIENEASRGGSHRNSGNDYNGEINPRNIKLSDMDK